MNLPIDLVSHILRARPETLADLQGHVSAAELATLVASGYVEVEGDAVRPVAPDVAVSGIARELLREQERTTAALRDLLDDLPGLARSWELGGNPDSSPLRAETVSGGTDLVARWLQRSARGDTAAPALADPTLECIRVHLLPHLDEITADQAARDYRLRVLLPSDAIADPANHALVNTLQAAGLEVRLLREIPSWLFVDGTSSAALPVHWAPELPLDVLLTTAKPIVELVAWQYAQWWRAATPFPVVGDAWRPVLRLMGSGRSDEQIAATLGLGVRTVRRRIAEAMEHYDVVSRFELGAAWGKDAVTC